jgi:hypothetical protein
MVQQARAGLRVKILHQWSAGVTLVEAWPQPDEGSEINPSPWFLSSSCPTDRLDRKV